MIYHLYIRLVSVLFDFLRLVFISFFWGGIHTIDCLLGYFVCVHLAGSAWRRSPSPPDCFGGAKSSRRQVVTAESPAASRLPRSTGGPAMRNCRGQGGQGGV